MKLIDCARQAMAEMEYTPATTRTYIRSGLSVSECARLRIRQLDFGTNLVILNNRTTVLPDLGREQLQAQATLARDWPGNVEGYVFPSSRMHGGRCWHVSPSSLQKALKQAAPGDRRITPRVLRHSFVLRLLEAGYDVRTVQEVSGFADVESVMVYQRMLDTRGVVSPLDELTYAEKSADE